MISESVASVVYCTLCQVASLSNSPLVSQAVMSPMVTRSLLADPLERDVLLALPYSRKKKNLGGEEWASLVEE